MNHHARTPVGKHILATSIAILLASALGASGQVTLTGSQYVENFDSLGSGLPTGWDVRTGASATLLGTTVSPVTGPVEWGGTTTAATSGAFKNYAAADGLHPDTNEALTGTEVKAVQDRVTDRALGIRQTGSFGDPGAAFNLQLTNTAGLSGFGLTFKAQMLSVQGRSTTWTLQYGLGDTPTSFTTLATYSDPLVFGSTLVNASGALSGISDQNQKVWLRIVALAATSGSNSRDSFGIDDFTLTYSPAIAALYWDLNGATAGVGGVSGTWDNATPNWSTSPAGTVATAAFNPSAPAIFSGTAGTVNVAGGGVTANGGLQFTTTGYTVQGGALTLGGVGPSINVANAADTTTISAPIAGTSGFTKSGEGRLVLSGTNTYTGSTAIAAGIVQVASDANLGDSTADISLIGGTLRTSADISLAAGRDLTGTGTLDLQAHVLTVNGAVNAGALSIVGGGTINFAGASAAVGSLNFDSATTLNSTPTLSLGGNITATHTSGTVTLNGAINPGGSNRTITTSDSAAAEDLVINSAFTGAGRVQLAGAPAAVIRLNGDSSAHTGGFRIDSGSPTVLLGNANALGAGQLFLNGGTLTAVSAFTIPTPISIGGNPTFTGPDLTVTGDTTVFGNTARTVTVNNNIVFQGKFGTVDTPTAASVTFEGTGTVTLANAANDIPGEVKVNGATVVLSGSLSATTSKLSVLAGTLKFNGSAAGDLIGGDGSGSDDALISLSEGVIAASPVGALFLFDDAVLRLEINSALRTSDALQISGTTLLGDGLAKLQITDLGNAPVPFGTTFTILNGTSGLTETDRFEGLPDLAQFMVSGREFQIDYLAGSDGQDIVLRAIPEPGSAALLLGALGILGGTRRRKRA